MKPHLIYVHLDDPPIEVKIHLSDLERQTGSTWRQDSRMVEVIPPEGLNIRPLRMGGAVDLLLVGHNAKHRRWLLAPI